MKSQSVEKGHFNISDLSDASALNCMKSFVTDKLERTRKLLPL